MASTSRVIAFMGLAAASCFAGGFLAGKNERGSAAERHVAARAVLDLLFTLRDSGRVVPPDPWAEAMCAWSRTVAEAAAESGALPVEDAFAQHLSRMEEHLAETKTLTESGAKSRLDLAAARYYVAEAKALVAREEERK